MPISYWSKDGKLIRRKNGGIIRDDNCCCGAPDCLPFYPCYDSSPPVVTLTLDNVLASNGVDPAPFWEWAEGTWTLTNANAFGAPCYSLFRFSFQDAGSSYSVSSSFNFHPFAPTYYQIILTLSRDGLNYARVSPQFFTPQKGRCSDVPAFSWENEGVVQFRPIAPTTGTAFRVEDGEWSISL